MHATKHPQWRKIYKTTIWATMSPSPACIIKHVDQVLCLIMHVSKGTATATFCMTIHSDVVRADTYLKGSGDFVIFVTDDGYFVGSASDVYYVMNEFCRRIRVSLNLLYSEPKCKMWFLDASTLRRFDVEYPECPYVKTLDGLTNDNKSVTRHTKVRERQN